MSDRKQHFERRASEVIAENQWVLPTTYELWQAQLAAMYAIGNRDGYAEAVETAEQMMPR